MQGSETQDYSRIQAATRERTEARLSAEEPEPSSQPKQAQKKPTPLEPSEPKSVRLVAYMGPLMAAGLKDVLDLVFVGSFPGFGTLVTFCLYLLIFLLFVVTDHLTVRSKTIFLLQAGIALVFGSAVEGLIFGLNFLPVGTGLIVSIFIREKKYALTEVGAKSA